ncbi:hypothetical protein ACFLYK_03810, partial [Candidatus Cloacimonadota bacterium]
MRYNPLSFLKKDDSIFGRAARNRWISGYEVQLELPHQEPNGSINNSVVDTIRHLYEISLISSNPNEKVNSALRWL